MPVDAQRLQIGKKLGDLLDVGFFVNVVFEVTRKPAAFAALMPSIASRNTPSRSTQMSCVFSSPSRCTLKKSREVGLKSARRLRMNMPFVQR